MIDVVITCRNYGRFLADAIESCLAQTSPCNIIVVNDGSLDETADVCAKYHKSITVELTGGKGLAHAANRGIALGHSPLVCRLDADDWLHPEFCMVMESLFNQRPGMASCYSDYLEDDNGKQRVVEQKGTPLGSCVVFDRYAFEASGGYDESLSFQEDFDLWQRIGQFTKSRTRNVKLPLWYYRQHDKQMSNAWNERQKVRHEIKEKQGHADKVLAVIPARGNSKGIARKNLRLLDGVPLVARAIRRAKQCERDMLLVVSTEDKEIAALAKREGADVIARPEELADDDVSCIDVVKHAMEHMDEKRWRADIVISIQVTDPFTPASALAEGIDLVKQGATSAVSVAEIMTTHPYRAFHLTEENGLVPYFEGKAEKYLQRQDRPKAYAFTGGFYVRRRELVKWWDGKGYALGTACRAVLLEPPVIDINNIQDLWLAESIIMHGRDG